MPDHDTKNKAIISRDMTGFLNLKGKLESSTLTMKIGHTIPHNGLFIIADTLSDRELRRIAYKIADGNWSKLGPTLGVKGMDYEQLLCSNLNVQEKIFRLLVLWKSQNNQPRGTLIPQLSDALEKTRRKDAARFVRDIGRVENSGSSVQSIKRKFMSSLKRS